MILIVKSVLHPSRIGAMLILAALAGCGQKGPLYLPAKPVPAATPAPQAAPPTAPAQTDSQNPASK
ncbi:LPS translocon maturation chaperone LptM [Noviherbaspirillum agri]